MLLRRIMTVVLGAALLGACGGGGAADSEETEGVDTAGVEVSGELGSKPQVSIPDGEPPDELIIVDLVDGDGAEVEPGASVTAHYVGVSWINEQEFDSSWDRGDPLTFPLSGVIAGWSEGLPGMRVGGRRLLIIPPEMGYGDQSPTPAIAANDTLVFVVDMVETQGSGSQ